MSSKKLSDEEFALMLGLIKRYAESEMDQSDMMRFDASHGQVFFNITMSDSLIDEAYTDVTYIMNKYNPQ